MTKATFNNIRFENLGRGSPLPAIMNDIKITCHHFYGAACILIYLNKNLGRGSPLSARASNQDISKKSYYPFIGQYASRYIHYIVTNGWYTSPPPSAMVVAHFTPPSGREGNTPPHPHPWGVTMHVAPETTMTIHSWLTDDSPPGSQMLLIHTMLPTWMLLSHTTLPPGSRCHKSCHHGLSHLRILQHTVDCTLGGAYKYTLYATSPGSHVASLLSSPGWGTINIQWSATFPWVSRCLATIFPWVGHHKYTMVCHLPLGTWRSVA